MVGSARRDQLAVSPRDNLEIGRARSRRAESSSGRRSVSKASEAQVVSNGEAEPTGGVGRALRAAALGPGRPGRALWSGRPRSPSSSGTPSACAGLFFTSISPRSTTRTAPSSPRSCERADSRAGARAFIAACRSSARARPAICTRSNTCSIPGSQTWQAFNLDTVLSVWLTGVGTYCWLRRHVGPAGALTGAAIFGSSGYVWGHLIHTSMINALASVPFVIWGLESSWTSGRWRGAVLGGLALACRGFRRPSARFATDHRAGGPVRRLPRGHGTRPGGPPALRWRWRSSLVGWVS